MKVVFYAALAKFPFTDYNHLFVHREGITVGLILEIVCILARGHIFIMRGFMKSVFVIFMF